MPLEIIDIKKKFKIAGEKKQILSGINLSVAAGELVSLTGKSGCGKTTLFNVISGLIPASSGRVVINGRTVRRFPDILTSRTRNREIGFVFQTFRLLNDESVYSNVLLPARIKGWAGKGTIAHADELLSRLKIYEYRNMKAAQLSGGQKQRVAIARALINRPSIILADEPTANLDTETASGIFEILISLKNENRSVVVITHSEYMHSISDRSFVMDNGLLERMK